MDKVSVGCIVYLIVVFERLQNHLKIYVNKIENVTYVSIYIILHFSNMTIKNFDCYIKCAITCFSNTKFDVDFHLIFLDQITDVIQPRLSSLHDIE